MKVKISPININILKNSYKILVLPDLHIPIDMDLKEIILKSEIFKEVNYVILLGDNVACYGNDKEYQLLNEFIKKMQKPYFAVNGNHEFMFEVIKYEDKNYGKIEDVKYFFIFCHAPLKGCEINGFKYYTDQGDPFIHLSKEIIEKIEKSKGITYWFSGHIHLNYNHPMSLIRKINKNLFQVNCPPSWKFSRRDLNDIVPKRHEEFSSLIIEKDKKIKLKIFEWIKNRFIKEIEI